jgi:dienelactone hydrolase
MSHLLGGPFSAGVIFLCSATAMRETQAQTTIEKDGLQVEQGALPIELQGREFNLEARIFRPVGVGPFPLILINHGTPTSSSDARKMKLDFTQAAEWFGHQGFEVLIALRPGFGHSDGPYMEETGPCNNRDYARDGLETAAIEAAIVTSASRLAGVDRSRIIVVGHSAGGFGAIALGDAPPPGVVGVISFAGGRGGDDNETICGGEKRLVDGTAILGKSNQVPQLWLFSANDHFFPPVLGHAMFEAYKQGSKQPMTFIDLPSFGSDGHQLFDRANPSVWASPVSAFIQTVLKR